MERPKRRLLLHPQEENGRSFAPAHYRSMVNAFAEGVKRVHSNNVVVAGGLFPFVINRPGAQAIGPLRFMREVLCLSKRNRPNCDQRVRFDVWSHHPYTSGGPTHRADNPDNVSIRDLPRMRKVLRAAVRYKRIIHNRSVRFWVTEFSWDSNPPDPKGVPIDLHARWVAEALYRMSALGRQPGHLVPAPRRRRERTTAQRDIRIRGAPTFCAGGLGCDRPKLSFQAFRFPFVAFRSGRNVRVWAGRPPAAPAV